MLLITLELTNQKSMSKKFIKETKTKINNLSLCFRVTRKHIICKKVYLNNPN